MIQLDATLTTLIQSETLLCLGLPKQTADNYFRIANNDMRQLSFPLTKPVCGTLRESDFPCWSSGRLIELYILCAKEAPRNLNKYISNRKDGSFLEQAINMIAKLLATGGLDFDKLKE